MPCFLVFDTESGKYFTRSTTGRQTSDPREAKVYRRKGPAINFASMRNLGRNLPPGYTAPDKYYRERPQVVVREVDEHYGVIETFDAPPQYIRVDLDRAGRLVATPAR